MPCWMQPLCFAGSSFVFWKWISSYYMCKLGDVYKAALPSGLKLESETAVTYKADFVADGPLRPNEQAVLDAFKGVLKLTVSELEKRTGLRNVVPIVASFDGARRCRGQRRDETRICAEDADIYPAVAGICQRGAFARGFC